jgi:DNA-binding response OmpR family regulator
MSEPVVYHIRIQGQLAEDWSDWFDGMTITCTPGDVTALTGPVADQAALHGLLAKVRDLGLALISVCRVYREFPAAEADILCPGDLIIDRTRGQVRRGNQPLTLTPTEFRLLVYLVQNKGQTLTRSQILEAVWGYDADVGDERSVNVHIRRLREKIELDPGRPALILTVPGIGYRFAA